MLLVIGLMAEHRRLIEPAENGSTRIRNGRGICAATPGFSGVLVNFMADAR